MSLRACSLLVFMLPLTAHAAEVVWLHAPADSEQSAQILALAEATTKGIPIESLPGLAAAYRQDTDGEALERLSATLRDVRMFEQRLDGELLIMRDLEPPLESVTVLRDAEDRELVFSALAYQGFAVDRFFEDDLSSDERAAPYRQTLGEMVVPRAWGDAAALQPERTISAYEIAEAPQRVHYESIRDQTNAALPGTLAIPDLPDGVSLVVDGERVSASDVARVPPGRHYAHLERDGQIVSRWTGRVNAGARVDLPLTPPDIDAARSWSESLPSAPPAELVDDLRAMGETVWLVDPRGAGKVYAWGPSGVTALDDVSLVGSTPKPESETTPTLGLAMGGGWMANRDFYFQNPVDHEPKFGTVNALGVVLSATAGVDLGPWRVEGGADVWWTPGQPHVAAFGANQTHFRSFLHVAAGIPEARLAVGWLTPHHLGFGPRLALPVGPLEIVGNGTMGIAMTPKNELGTWKGTPIYSGWIGAGWRFGARD